MTALRDEEQALLAVQVAALREAGLSSGRALALAAEALPSSELRPRLVALAASLERGEVASAQPGSGEHALVTLFAAGESVAPSALREAARGLINRWEATEAVRGLLMPVAIAWAVMMVLLSAAGWGLQLSAVSDVLFGDSPAPTQMAFGVLSLLRWAGPVLAVLGLVLAARFPARWTPGARELMAAASLRLEGALLAAGASRPDVLRAADLPLHPQARWFSEQLQSRFGPGLALEAVASSLEELAARRRRFWSVQLPVVAGVLFAVSFGPVLAAVYLPIFTLAGSIQ